jgi:hypothetical protein
MPIRLNLLAEAQALEDLRRRDPVKRAMVGAGLLVACMLVWSSSVQLKVILSNGELSSLEANMSARTNMYHHVLDNQTRIGEIKDRLLALQRLSTNRFLNATMLNALQHATADDLQLLKVKVEQTYAFTAASIPPATPSPPNVTEHILLTLDASDTSANPGDLINKLKEMVSNDPYFHEALDKTNAVSLKTFSQPQLSPVSGRQCVLFTLECRYPDRTMR